MAPRRKRPSAPTPPENRNYDLAETAVFLGVPWETFQEWLRDGRFPPPRGWNERLKHYPAKVLRSLKLLLDCGFLPMPEKPTRGKPAAGE